MLFNSLAFLLFFPAVVALYFLTPHRARWAVLLAASYLFYGWWRVEYLSLILLSTAVDYGAGLRMGALPSRAARRPWLVLSLVTNLGLLAAFKYLGFFAETAEALAAFVGADGRLHVPALLLPVGISFYTFQTLAYAIDVYRGRMAPERHFGMFALYVSFWPQLVAGPIERSQRLLPQFRERHRFDPARVADGLTRMAWGFFKKVVVADRLALAVDAVYGAPGEADAAAVVLATYFFAVQIYCDFSGYTDIAIGAARVMGFDLMENFRRPYFARSIREFWARWHISLTTWFRDYLYIPLGGNRVSPTRWRVNVVVVFLLSGLWHGAAWTFVVWGALHGLYLIVGEATQGARDRAWAWLGARGAEVPAASTAGGPRLSPEAVRRGLARLTTFHLVLLAWVFFRADALSDVGQFAATLLDPARLTLNGLGVGLVRYELLLGVLGIGVLLGVDVVERRRSLRGWLLTWPAPARHVATAAFLLSILMFGEFGAQEFIYFQF